MSNAGKLAIGAVVALVALVLFMTLPGWLAVAILAVPVVGYFLLDSSQRRRLRGLGRKQIGK